LNVDRNSLTSSMLQ